MPRGIKTALLAALAAAAALALPAAASAVIYAGNTGWRWSSPEPTGNALTVLDVAGSRLWVAGGAGTLAYSDTDGFNWTGVRTGLLDDIRHVDAISDSSIVFAGRCALRRTDDAGVTIRRLPWTASDDNCQSGIAELSFPTAQAGYLLLENATVYGTYDGGVSWQKRGVLPADATTGAVGALSDMYFNTNGEGVVAAGNRILRSFDGGVNWTPVSGQDIAGGEFKFNFVADHLGLAVGSHSDLLVTYDGGSTWSVTAGDGMLRASTFSSVSCNYDFSVCLALPSDGGEVLRSVDKGEHWSSTGARWQSAVFRGQQWFAVSSDGVSVGNADASSWQNVTRRLTGSFNGLHSLSSGSVVAYGPRGSIAVGLQGGRGGWVNQNLPGDEPASVRDAFDLGAKGVLAVDTAGRLYRSKAVSSTASPQPWGGALKLKPAPRAIHAWSGGQTLLVGPRGVRVSRRWGRSATAVPGFLRRQKLTRVDASGNTAVVSGAKAVAVTGDRGRRWKRMSLPAGVSKIKALDVVSKKLVFLLDGSNELYKTNNLGRKWSRVETTGANTATSMAFSDARHGYIGDGNGRILATDDGGATWARQYPYFDSSEGVSPLLISGSRGKLAVALRSGSNSIFSTTTGGRIGSRSVLTIKPSATRVVKGDVIPVTGRLSSALGGERVAVMARIVGAPAGTAWVTQNATVAADGTFTTRWKITAATRFIARWSGDAMNDGDGAPAKIVRINR